MAKFDDSIFQVENETKSNWSFDVPALATPKHNWTNAPAVNKRHKRQALENDPQLSTNGTTSPIRKIATEDAKSSAFTNISFDSIVSEIPTEDAKLTVSKQIPCASIVPKIPTEDPKLNLSKKIPFESIVSTAPTEDVKSSVATNVPLCIPIEDANSPLSNIPFVITPVQDSKSTGSNIPCTTPEQEATQVNEGDITSEEPTVKSDTASIMLYRMDSSLPRIDVQPLGRWFAFWVAAMRKIRVFLCVFQWKRCANQKLLFMDPSKVEMSLVGLYREISNLQDHILTDFDELQKLFQAVYTGRRSATMSDVYTIGMCQRFLRTYCDTRLARAMHEIKELCHNVSSGKVQLKVKSYNIFIAHGRVIQSLQQLYMS